MFGRGRGGGREGGWGGVGGEGGDLLEGVAGAAGENWGILVDESLRRVVKMCDKERRERGVSELSATNRFQFHFRGKGAVAEARLVDKELRHLTHDGDALS